MARNKYFIGLMLLSLLYGACERNSFEQGSRQRNVAERETRQGETPINASALPVNAENVAAEELSPERAPVEHAWNREVLFPFSFDLFIWANFYESEIFEVWDEDEGAYSAKHIGKIYVAFTNELFVFHSTWEYVSLDSNRKEMLNVTNFALQNLSWETATIQELIRFQSDDLEIEYYPVGYKVTGTALNTFRNRWPENNWTITVYVFPHKDDPSKLLYWYSNPALSDFQYLSRYMDKIDIDSGFLDEMERVIEAQKAEEELKLQGEFLNAVEITAFSPDSSQIVTTTENGPIILWDLATGQEVKRFIGHIWPGHLNFTPDGKKILSRSRRTIKLWDIETGDEVWTYTIPSPAAYGVIVVSLHFSSDERQIFLGMSDRIVFLDISTGNEVRSISIPIYTYSVSISPDESRIVTGNSLDNSFNQVETVHLWDTETGNLIISFYTGDPGSTLFSPNGRCITVRSRGRIQFFDAETFHEINKFAVEQSKFVSFSPDSRYMLSCETDNTLKLFDAESGSFIRAFSATPERYSLHYAIFSPDSRHIVSEHGGSDRFIVLWDAETGNEIRRFTGFSDLRSIYARFSPDSRYVLAGYLSYRKTISDVASGAIIMTLGGEFPPRE